MKKFIKRFPLWIIGMFIWIVMCFVLSEVLRLPWLILVSCAPIIGLIIDFVFVTVKEMRDELK